MRLVCRTPVPKELIQRWGELEPWPETSQVVHALLEKVPVAVVTNASSPWPILRSHVLG